MARINRQSSVLKQAMGLHVWQQDCSAKTKKIRRLYTIHLRYDSELHTHGCWNEQPMNTNLFQRDCSFSVSSFSDCPVVAAKYAVSLCVCWWEWNVPVMCNMKDKEYQILQPLSLRLWCEFISHGNDFIISYYYGPAERQRSDRIEKSCKKVMKLWYVKWTPSGRWSSEN